MVKLVKSWETVYFYVSKDRDTKAVSVEVNINRANGTFTICTPNEESVSFKNTTVEEAELKAKAVNASVKYIKSVLNERQGKKKKGRR